MQVEQPWQSWESIAADFIGEEDGIAVADFHT